MRREYHRGSAIDRLLARVSYSAGCWEFRGAHTPDGYGRLNAGRGRSVLVHRLAYEELEGPMPAGMDLDHLCRNTGCCNPLHLEPVSRSENNRRGLNDPPNLRGATHCVHGHEFTANNTYVRPNGSRSCRKCGLRRVLESQRKRKNAQNA